MKVLVGCEFSGRVRDAFIAKGHDAISCDILPTEKPGPHIQEDIRKIDLIGYDMAILFPPCTRLCRSGQRWIEERNLHKEQEEAIEFFMWCTRIPIDKVAIENPVGIMSTVYKKPTQVIQPYYFGLPENKATCLWLKNLPPLVATNMVESDRHSIHHMTPSPNRSKDRSKTFLVVARAMAQQWG